MVFCPSIRVMSPEYSMVRKVLVSENQVVTRDIIYELHGHNVRDAALPAKRRDMPQRAALCAVLRAGAGARVERKNET